MSSQYPPPPPPPPGYGQYGQMQGPVFGGFWLRFVAYVIDAVILNIVGYIVRLILSAVMGGRVAGNTEFDTVTITSGFIGLVVAWLYFAFQESSEAGATLGKRILGLRVVRGIDGSRLTFARATGRFLAKFVSAFILLIGYIMAGFTERKRALHDMIADTVVIKT